MSIKKNLTYNLFLQVLNTFFPIITIPYISRILGVENIGIINFVITYVSYFILLANFGVSYYGVREIAKYRDNKLLTSQVFSEIFKINLIATIIASLCFVTSVFFVSELKEERSELLVVGLTLFLAPISIDWYFQGQENFKMITIRSTIVKLLSFISIFIFIKDKYDVIPYCVIYAISTIGSNIWNIIYAQKKGLKINIKNTYSKPHLKGMFIFFLSTFATTFFAMMSIIILKFISTYQQVGLATSAHKIVFVVIGLFSAIWAVMLPRVSNNIEKKNLDANNTIIQKTFDLIVFISIPATIGLALCSSHLIPLYLGSGFDGAIVPLQIMSFLIFIVAFNGFFGVQILFSHKLETKYLISVVIAAIISLTSNIILLPLLSSVGLSIALIIAEGVECLIIIYCVYRYTEIKIKWNKVFEATVCTLLFLPCFYIMNKFILSNLIFLLCFCVSSVVLYLYLQYHLFKNSLIKSTFNSLTTILKK